MGHYVARNAQYELGPNRPQDIRLSRPSEDARGNRLHPKTNTKKGPNGMNKVHEQVAQIPHFPPKSKLLPAHACGSVCEHKPKVAAHDSHPQNSLKRP